MVHIMLKRLERAEQKWGGSNKLIDQWLNHRRKLLISYCQIAGLPPYNKVDKVLPALNEINKFCDLLVDYVSEGHFEVYDEIVSECETHGDNSKAVAKSLLPQISDTTDVALDFNDKYSKDKSEEVVFHLDADLGLLIHALESRFALEDQLLEVLHHKHPEQAES